MEVEAKFSIPDEQTLARLLETPALAGYTLGQAVQSELHDRYLDTPQGTFLAAGYAFRLRRVGDRNVVTLKGLGQAEGAVHRRAEHEICVPDPLNPDEWPAGPVREIVLQLRGSQPLQVLFEIDQRRLTRPMLDGERPVADLSCDRFRVWPRGGAQAQPQAGNTPERGHGEDQAAGALPEPGGALLPGAHLELEIELQAGGTEADLARIVRELDADWRLSPVSQSKFHRALAMLHDDQGAANLEDDSAPNLTPEERTCLVRLAQGRAVLARRARLLLAWDDGASPAEMLARSELSPRRARYWRWAFRRSRMGIFPAGSSQSALVEAEPQGVPAEGGEVEPVPPGLPEPPQPTPASTTAVGQSKRIGLSAGALMSDAGRLVLGFHFQRMLANEAGTREDRDVEALHDMRVATRRMRAAFRVFGDFYDPRVTLPFVKALRRAGRALGQVRDLDVFEQKTLAYSGTLPQAQRGGLEAFIAELHARRDTARQLLLAHLDSSGYRRFVARFPDFVESREEKGPAFEPADGQPRPVLVRHVAPLAIMERLAAVRAFEGWMEAPNVPLERYHALRIATKRLRYALEFFSEMLGPEGKALVGRTVALQDHLGLLQDGVVASGILRDFLMWGTWGTGLENKSPGRTDSLIAPGVALYLAARQTEIQELLAGFPAVWARISGPEFTRALTATVGVL